MDYFDSKNTKLYDFLNDTFQINKHRRWEDVAKNITLEKVKKTYKFFAKLFPRNHSYFSELEGMKDSFSSIHFGTIKANRIIEEVVRFSLYSDKIIVFHPLQNPSITAQNMDPRWNPKSWLPDFLDSLYFYIVVQKWVKFGIIKLIINPYHYDFEIRDMIDKQVEQRLNNSYKELYIDIDKSTISDEIAEIFAIGYKNKNKDYIVQSLLKMSNPIFSEDEAHEFADKIIKVTPKINPLYNKLGVDLRGSKTINPTKTGGPLESILLISEKTGANIYSPSEMEWNQIKNYGQDDFWLKVNHLYSKIPLNFLNNVDVSFALEMRLEDRLSGVRIELQKIYSELKNIEINQLNESKIRLIQEGFIEELKRGEADWKLIIKEANLARKNWFATSAVGIPFITNEISILPLAIGAIGSASWLYKHEMLAREKKKAFKTKNPISVYIDLKNKKENFFTEFRNCIL